MESEMELTISINGKEAKISGFDQVSDIVCNIPDLPEFMDITHEFAKSSSQRIRFHIARRDFLRDDTIKLLLNDENGEVIRYVLQNENTAKLIKIEHIEKIFNSNHLDAIMSLIRVSEVLEYNEEIYNYIFDNALNHRDPEIRYELARNLTSDRKYLRILTKDKDANVAKEASEKLEKQTYSSNRRGFFR